MPEKLEAYSSPIWFTRAKPSNRFRILGFTKKPRKGTGVLRVRVPSGGRVRLAGAAVRRVVKTPGGPKTLRMTVRLKRKAEGAARPPRQSPRQGEGHLHAALRRPAHEVAPGDARAAPPPLGVTGMTARTRFLAAVAAAVAYGVFLLLSFEVDVQQDSAADLVARDDDARSFLVADLFFPPIYGFLVPLAALAFARRSYGGAEPIWVKAAAASLVIAGLCDWGENILLLASLETESPNRVDAAHAIAIPKLVFFGLGTLGMLALLYRAIRERSRPSARGQDAPPAA